jgi:non-ribosomal peptide synthetase component F
LSDDTGFVELLGRVQNEVLECFHHQSYPLEIIFEKLGMRYPDIPVSFNMVNIPGSREARELEFYTPYHSSEAFDAKFELEPYIIEYQNGIDIRWAYKKSMFDAPAIESFAADYIKFLEFFTGNPGKSYSDFKAAGKKRQFKRNIPAAT